MLRAFQKRFPIGYLSIGQWSTIDNKELEGSYDKQDTQKCCLVDYVTFGIGLYRIVELFPWRVRYPTTPPDEPIANVTRKALLVQIVWHLGAISWS